MADSLVRQNRLRCQGKGRKLRDLMAQPTSLIIGETEA